MTETMLGGQFTFPGTDLTVNRVGYGAMQLAGPGVFGPPRDPDAAVAVLRAAVEAGVKHIDTSDFYGPHVTNYRSMGMGAGHGPGEGSIAEQVSALADLQRQGLIRHVGLSNVTAAQVAEAQAITNVVCVQNQYNLVHREDDALIDSLAAQGIAYVPFFPLGGFNPLQSATLSDVAGRLGATTMQVALARLLQRSPNLLLIPGTSSVAHLRENLAAGQLTLAPEVVAELDGIAEAAPAAAH